MAKRNHTQSDSESELTQNLSQKKKKNAGKKILEDHAKTRPNRCKELLETGEQCPKRYQTKSGLAHHVDTKHRGIRHKCTLCGQTFTLKSDLNKHTQLIHGNNVPLIKCELCTAMFKSKKDLNRHKYNVHKLGDKIKCPVCCMECSSKETLQQHVSNMHRKSLSSDVALPQPPRQSVASFSQQSSSSQDTVSDFDSLKLRKTQFRQEDPEPTGIAVIAVTYQSDTDISFKRTKISLIEIEDETPTFEFFRRKFGYTCNLYYRGTNLAAYKLTKEVSKTKSFYFPVAGREYAEFSKTVISICLAYFCFLKNPDSMSQELETLDFATRLDISHFDKNFITEFFKANKISLLYENKEEFVQRTKRPAPDFKRTTWPSLFSKTDLGYGHVYILKTLLNGKAYVYIGQVQAKRKSKVGGRSFSSSHLMKNGNGSLSEFRSEHPDAEFKDTILYYLTKQDSGVTNPTAEAASIMAFYLMQGCGLRSETSDGGEEFELINTGVVFESWTKDFVRTIRLLVLKFGGRRINFWGESDNLPEYPNIEAVFTLLGAKTFS